MLLAFFTQCNSLEIHRGHCMCQELIFFFFLLLWCTLFHGYRVVCFTIHWLKNIWAGSSCHLPWIKLLCTFVDRLLCECKVSFLWDKYQGVRLLPSTAVACLFIFCTNTFYSNCSSKRISTWWPQKNTYTWEWDDAFFNLIRNHQTIF